MKISIITVCLNAEDTIKETLHSVSSQTYPDIEHIIVDGNSDDKTLQIINSFDNEQIKLISEPDTGIYDAMNKGLAMATGEYVFFLNSNDKFLHNKVVEIFANKGLSLNKDLIFGTYLELDSQTGKYGIKKQTNLNKFDLWQSCPLQPTLFYKKTLFEKFGNFNTNYKICGDYDWAIRVFSKEPLTLQYIDTLITLFDTNGISSGRTLLHQKERNIIENLYFSKTELFIFNLINSSKWRKIARTKIFGKIFSL